MGEALKGAKREPPAGEETRLLRASDRPGGGKREEEGSSDVDRLLPFFGFKI